MLAQLLEVETGLRRAVPAEAGTLLEVGRRSPRVGRSTASEEAGGHDGSGPEDRACAVSCGLEETGLRHPAFIGPEPANWFSASSTADKKSYEEAETVRNQETLCFYCFRHVVCIYVQIHKSKKPKHERQWWSLSTTLDHAHERTTSRLLPETLTG